ncbi:MAG: hypothetical protein ACREIP_02895 [Alphaproteobacteria bacterium]
MISFWKILLLVVVIAGVWAAVSIYRRNQRQQEIKAAGGGERPKMAHVNTVACRVCGTYVPERGAAKCGRADCPV